MAIQLDGTIWTWGQNSRGQLGNGSSTSSNVPISLSKLCPATGNVTDAEDSFTANVFPNPGLGIFNITLSTSAADIEVYDPMGKLIVSQKMEGKTSSIDLSEFSSGIYQIRVLQNGTIQSNQKVVKL